MKCLVYEEFKLDSPWDNSPWDKGSKCKTIQKTIVHNHEEQRSQTSYIEVDG
jgi:hypothetical protein